MRAIPMLNWLGGYQKGWLRLDLVASFISEPVLTGFKAGVGLGSLGPIRAPKPWRVDRGPYPPRPAVLHRAEPRSGRAAVVRRTRHRTDEFHRVHCLGAGLCGSRRVAAAISTSTLAQAACRTREIVASQRRMLVTGFNNVGLWMVGRTRQVGAGWMLAVVSFLLLVSGTTPAVGREPPPSSAPPHATPMDQINMANPEPGQALVTAPVEPEKKSPFFDDSRIGAQARAIYLYRDRYDDTIAEAFTLGGSVVYASGYAADIFKVGAVAYTSQPVHAPEDRDGTLLLQPGQAGYTVLGELYGEVKITDQIFSAFGRKEYNTPYINKNDVRMTPNTFEGGSIYGTAGGKDDAGEWRFGGGYITKIKERNSEDFVWMSVVAGASVERGVYVAGANFKKGDLSLGAVDYYSDDIINIFYTETRFAPPLGDGHPLKVSAQFTDQQSTGDELLTGTGFSTYQWGLKADLALGAGLLTLAYTDTAGGDAMRSPWGGYPGYTSVQVENFNRAGESAVMLRGFYDFSAQGLKGISAYALWVHGTGVKAPQYNEDEVDLNLQWTPDESSALRGMSFRLRYAKVMQDGGGDPDIDDFRIIVNYDFPAL